MTTQTSKIFIWLLISLVILTAVETIFACAGSDESSEGKMSVFAPEIIRQPSKAPFFLSPHIYYSLEGFGTPETIPTLTERNTAEWLSFFDNKIATVDIEWLIYGSTISHIEMLKKCISDKRLNVDTLNKAVVKALRKKKNNTDILDYIIFAKASEKYFNPYGSWEPVIYDSAYIQRLIPVCLERFKKIKLPFIKHRYGFQVTRALSVSGRHADCIRFYDDEFNPSEMAESMYYRSLGYKARSLYKLQQYSLANYLYAYLYNADPCQRYMAYQSFHPQEETDWNGTLALAKTTSEKESLWELFGLYGNTQRAINEIYTINPQSNSLPLLLVRSVNIAEEQMLVNPAKGYRDFYYADYTDSKTPGDNDNYERNRMDSISQGSLSGIIDRVIRERKTNKLTVWQLSGAYLSLLRGDYNSASAILSSLPTDEKDSLLLGQAAILRGILAVRKLTSVDAAAEKLIYGHVQNVSAFIQPELRKENALRYMMSRLSLVYENQKDLLKKELAYPQGNSYYTTAERTQGMISFMNRKGHSPLELYMLGKYPLQLIQLYEVKAVNYMYEYKFTEAMHEFEKIIGAGITELDANPFTIHITDCHDCDRVALKSTGYTKYSFAKKMQELKSNGDNSIDRESRAQNYFLYANGVYNMTWYGNSRIVHGTAVSFDDYNSVVYGKNEKLRASNFFNCEEALAYYQKAYTLSRNKEFRAKCVWMSAKCEQNLWLDNSQEDRRNDFIAGRYFGQMKSGFSDTRYYNEVINECGYFCTYITGRDSCKRNW